MLIGPLSMRKLFFGSKKQLLKPAPEKVALKKPHNYQHRAVKFLVGNCGAGIFADPGTGKTAIVLRAFLALLDANVGERMLVVAPLRVCYKVWPHEPKEWAGSDWDRLKELRIVVLHGKDKEKLLNADADIFVINFEGFANWLLAEDARRLKMLNPDVFVVDESSKFKNTRTQRFHRVKKILRRFRRRWILTGSPNPNGYMNLFGQIYIIDEGRALGHYITDYRRMFFTPQDLMGWTWTLNKGADVQIQKAIAPYIFRLDADDHLELPEIVENVIRVDLPPKAREIYDDLENEFLARIDEMTVIEATSAGGASMKCAQVANGGLYHMDTDLDTWGKRVWTNLHEAKTDAVEEIIEELNGSPALVVYDFKHDLDRLRKRFGEKIPYLGGGVSAKQSEGIIDAWNRDELEILFVHGQTVAHGLNMQYGTAQHIIWHSMTYDREIYDQLNRRLRRQGSKQKQIFVHQIVSVATVDTAKKAALKMKGEVQSNFLLALKKYAAGRKRS